MELWAFLDWVVHPLFHPLPGLTHFLWSCPKKVSKEMRARDGDFPLNFRNRAENGKTRFAQTVPVLFSARLQNSRRHLGQGTAEPSAGVC
ncbi:hypothetical protein RCG55_13820, partial [Staphylococcus aureus]|uniref:hypothetical protein n=1 Tax=Staphylococcus aureus TaxID=1280 RepID=UPI0027EC5080